MASAGSALAAGTDYTFVPTGDIAEGQYGVETTPVTQRPDLAWGNYSAPGGSGTFQVFNAGPSAGERFWYDTVGVTTGTTYDVTAVIANNYSVSPPVLQFTVGGVAQGAAFTLPGPYGTNYTTGAPGPWQSVHFGYTSGLTGNATFALVDTNTAAGGNDFSVASVSVAAVSAAPEPAAWALMFVGVGVLGAALRKRKGSSVAGVFAA